MMELPQKITYLLLCPVFGLLLFTGSSENRRGAHQHISSSTSQFCFAFGKGNQRCFMGDLFVNLLVSLIVGVITFLGLWILGVGLSSTIGSFIRILDIIPYFGPFPQRCADPDDCILSTRSTFDSCHYSYY